jgi:1-acyl-sn-glycerol-3-phosphate acyltransferase
MRACDSAYLSNHCAPEQLHTFSGDGNSLVNGLRAVAALVIRAWLRCYHRFEVIAPERLRTNRSLVIVANHSSHLDTLCLLAALPLRKLHRAFPAAAADYFFRAGPRTWIAAVVNAFPFSRKFHVRRSLSICRQLTGEPGNILIMFPEGTRSPTGRMQQFKLGVPALVAGRDVAVVPCYLQGAFDAWPKGRRLPRPGKIRLIIGNPRTYSTRTTDKRDLCMIAADLERAVRQLGTRNGID